MAWYRPKEPIHDTEFGRTYNNSSGCHINLLLKVQILSYIFSNIRKTEVISAKRWLNMVMAKVQIRVVVHNTPASLPGTITLSPET